MSTTYMTARLKLADGTYLYPQISLDNMVKSLQDNTAVSVVTTVGASGVATNNQIPTAAAVRSLADTKQNTLVAGTGTEIINGSTINAMAVNLNDVVVNNVPNNGLSLVVEGNTMSVVGALAANDSAGVIAGATNGVQLVDGVAQFDNATVDAATPEEITGGTAKVIQADGLNTALHLDWETVQMERLAFNAVKCERVFIGSTTNVHGEITGGTVHCSNFIGSDAGYAGIQWTNARHSMPKLNKAGKYLVTVEVYNNLTGAEDRVLMSGSVGISIISGIPYYTDAHNTWVKLGVLVTPSGELAVDKNITFYTRSTATTVDFYMRNLAIMDVTDIPASDYVTVFNNSGYVYKPGDGIEFDADKIQIDNASTLDVLNGVGTDGNPLYDRVLTPGNLKNALSIGQAVDCTAVPAKTASISITDDDGVAVSLEDVYRDSFHAKVASWGGGWVYLGFGGDGFTDFYPKAANTADGTPLQYLIMADLENTGSSVVRVNFYVSLADGTDKIREGAMQYWNYYLLPGEKKRYSCMFWAKMDNGVSKTRAAFSFYRQYGTGDLDVKISNLREFEVMALTDDAVMCLANIKDPDDANSLYLLKTDMVSPWTNIINMGSAPAVTLASGLAYKSTVVTGSTCVFSTDTCPAGTYGRDAHLTLFVGLDSQVFFQYPLSLMDPLTPGAGHNMTIKYRDGQALAYVDDTDIGYVVTVASGTSVGSLYYGVSDPNNTYIVFSQTVDGQTISMPAGTELSGTRNFVGNGTETTILGGTFTLGKPNLEAITFSGLDSSAQNFAMVCMDGTAINNCVFENSIVVPTATYPNGGIIQFGKGGVISNTTFTNTTGNACICRWSGTTGGDPVITNCRFIDNNCDEDIRVYSSTLRVENSYFHTDKTSSYRFIRNGNNSSGASGTTTITGCTFAGIYGFVNCPLNAKMYFEGYNKSDGKFSTSSTGAEYHFLSGSVLDLSENTWPTVMTSPYIGVDSGSASVIPYGGGGAPVAITGTGNSLMNNGRLGFRVRVLSGTAANSLYDAVIGGGTAYSNIIFDIDATDTKVTELTIDGGTITALTSLYFWGNGPDKTTMKINGGQLYRTGKSLRFRDLTLTGVNPDGAILYKTANSYTEFTNCVISGVTANGSYLTNSRPLIMKDCIVQDNQAGSLYSDGGNGDASITNVQFINNKNGILQLYHDATITNCLFNNPVFSTYGLYNNGSGNVVITGSTFANPGDGIRVISGGTISFAETNILNSTVFGDGTVVLADGATVTSTIPSGSTIGTGVLGGAYIKCANTETGTATLSNLTISGMVHPSGVGANQAVVFSGEMTNVEITGNTVPGENAGIVRLFGTSVLTSVNMHDNVTSGTWQGLYFYKDSTTTLDGCTFSQYSSSSAANITVIFKNTNTFTAKGQINLIGTNGKIYILAGSTIDFSDLGAYSHIAPLISVGHFDENDTWVEGSGDTATVIPRGGGSAVTISGHGNNLNYDGTLTTV